MAKQRKYDVQIRGVPGDLRDALKLRARRKGVSMSQYVIRVIKDDIGRPTIDEWIDEVQKLPRVPGVSGGAIVRELRDALEKAIEA